VEIRAYQEKQCAVTSARFIIGKALDVLKKMPDQSVHCVITSPPYLKKRDYLPLDHPDKAHEIGQEDSPGEFLASLLRITNELWRVLPDDGSIWINLGDTAAGSGGSGGDYNAGGLREGQPAFRGTAAAINRSKERTAPKWILGSGGLSGPDWPLRKSVCWVPQLFGASLAYGRNLLNGEPCQQWVTRPPITWCKPNPTVGEVIDKCREATELIIFAVKTPEPGGYYFDLDSIRESTDPANERSTSNQDDPKARTAELTGAVKRRKFTQRTSNPNGRPPYDWWLVPSDGYEGAHFAVMPPELLIRPVLAGCPAGGIILDPFAGTGTTLMVATGHGRDAIGVDFDERNAGLARERIGMFLTVEDWRS
jgi:DNA modification methylase